MAENDFLSPEDIEALSSLGISKDRLGQLGEQYAQAKDMRFAPTPEGRSSGRVYAAANPLEHIGRGIGAYRGGKAMQGIGQEMSQIAAQDAAVRRKMMEQIMRQQGVGMLPQAGPQMSPAPGMAPQGMPTNNYGRATEALGMIGAPGMAQRQQQMVALLRGQ